MFYNLDEYMKSMYATASTPTPDSVEYAYKALDAYQNKPVLPGTNIGESMLEAIHRSLNPSNHLCNFREQYENNVESVLHNLSRGINKTKCFNREVAMHTMQHMEERLNKRRGEYILYWEG